VVSPSAQRLALGTEAHGPTLTLEQAGSQRAFELAHGVADSTRCVSSSSIAAVRNKPVRPADSNARRTDGGISWMIAKVNQIRRKL
jgi:hypothetical protein